MPIHRFTTTDSIKKSKPPMCAVCKERREGVTYGFNEHGQLVCQPCWGSDVRASLIRVISEDEDAPKAAPSA